MQRRERVMAIIGRRLEEQRQIVDAQKVAQRLADAEFRRQSANCIEVSRTLRIVPLLKDVRDHIWEMGVIRENYDDLVEPYKRRIAISLVAEWPVFSAASGSGEDSTPNEIVMGGRRIDVELKPGVPTAWTHSKVEHEAFKNFVTVRINHGEKDFLEIDASNPLSDFDRNTFDDCLTRVCAEISDVYPLAVARARDRDEAIGIIRRMSKQEADILRRFNRVPNDYIRKARFLKFW